MEIEAIFHRFLDPKSMKNLSKIDQKWTRREKNSQDEGQEGQEDPRKAPREAKKAEKNEKRRNRLTKSRGRRRSRRQWGGDLGKGKPFPRQESR